MRPTFGSSRRTVFTLASSPPTLGGCMSPRSTGDPEAGTLAAMAKVHCSESLAAIAGEMVQMHGGLAITWEHDAHLYLRRAYADAHLFGGPGEHLDRLATTLLA